MRYQYQYTTSEERQSLMSANSDKYLVEEKTLFADETGTKKNFFIIFSDEIPEVQTVIKEVENSDLTTLQENQQTIKDGMADMYMAIASIPGVAL